MAFGELTAITPPLDGGTLTVGGTLTTGCIQTWPWDNTGTAWPYATVCVTPPPYWCSGNVHVFGCDHAEKCKCGKSKRKVEPPTCPHCGKAHS